MGERSATSETHILCCPTDPERLKGAEGESTTWL